ncbi:dATP/dGTP diphosphohydrolase domain-containing protein [Micromonospora sp. CB01531]|uniref:dATP/dGTP diphosphohydrolase domain-containing protein n=1 Tax=Micromonospora sp. CB01531 TaxID=1718947 RepID=UPI0011610094|nr:dATP/dGTP diphosphohydrolase domain-containing protein [Micromonospora sp. CB01531]
MRVRSGERVVVTGDEACLDHGIQPGTEASIQCQGYRPDVWMVTVDGKPPLRQVHEDDMTEPSFEVVRKTSATGGQKDAKPARFDQIPTLSLRQLAERYGFGNSKYPVQPGELDNWRKGYAWSLSYAALQRHVNAFWSGEDLDPETGQPHLIAAAWHCFTLNEWAHRPALREQFDDRQDRLQVARDGEDV